MGALCRAFSFLCPSLLLPLQSAADMRAQGDRCNQFDRIWVPGRFHMQTFLAGGVERGKLRNIPEAVDTHFYDPDRVAPLQLPLPPSLSSNNVASSSIYRFLSVFKWEERKAWRVLLRAYFEEFKRDEPIVLYILTSPYHDSTPIELVIDTWLREQGLPPRTELPPIVLLSRLPVSLRFKRFYLLTRLQ
jgi:hypothetical protein